MANISEVLGSAAAIAKGMGITFKEMLQPTITEGYPDAPATLEERYRGAHVLQRDENGLEKCVACFLCAAACPANCIYIEAAENTDQQRFSGGERYAKVYNIDYNRCIFCGYCVEACPTDAITHGHGFELASYNTSTLVYRKEQMLVQLPQGGKTPSQHSPAPAGDTGVVRYRDARVTNSPGIMRAEPPDPAVIFRKLLTPAAQSVLAS